jgi:Holliday junction resolvase-like predicted endonuclease
VLFQKYPDWNSGEYGSFLELFVLSRLLLKKHTFLNWKLKTPFGEVDLVTKSRDSLFIWEIKSAPALGFEGTRICRAQRLRLQRAALYLQQQTSAADIEAYEVQVSTRGGLEIFDFFA